MFIQASLMKKHALGYFKGKNIRIILIFAFITFFLPKACQF